MTATIDPATVLAEKFGFSQFRPGQQQVIEHLVAGRSAAAVFPTGGGKSLCYQLPALMLPGVTLVVSPLIALMKDQIDALKRRGIAAAQLDSSQTHDEHTSVIQRVRSGDLRMLYVAPERFNNERFRDLIRQVRVSLFAVDEAHCISEWGHAFRPDYLKLARFAKQCGAERTFALTATATLPVLEDMCRLFSIEPECVVKTGFFRPNLQLLTTPIASEARDALLVRRLRERDAGPTIVYVTLQRTAEEVAAKLVADGLPAQAYHAGMPSDQRTKVQDWFVNSKDHIVVATIAFGMGIDKADIRYVYHYNFPKSLENYSQEVGRAGRDCKPSICEMFLCNDDRNVLENFVYGDTPTRGALESLLADLFSQPDDFDVSQYELSSEHDVRNLVISTLLTYLELDDYLEGGTPFYSTYQFQPQASSQDILSRFDEQRRNFLTALFRHAQKRKTWFSIDPDSTAEALQTDRQRIIRAIDYLAEQGLLIVKAAGVRHRYRTLKRPPSSKQLAAELHQQMLDREKREIQRIDQVVQLSQHDDCQAALLSEYFGEPLNEPCGNCTSCLDSGDSRRLAAPQSAKIPDKIWRDTLALCRKHKPLLQEPTVVARFLCGVSSPQMVRAKLTKEKLFGSLSHVPFRVVRDHAASANGSHP